ncbi:NAD(P)/FAD-dependent oxidoreductase [Cohnella yongneupensis]|uniref:NAD(P)/FAD-dependent oxidoreductase n=1 Tax=Cohnella yongneupensis TaxID=425006 RepID=A0ABW0QX05_9BACL
MTAQDMVIIGAGEAGARAAVELRSQGWNGKITMIGEEKHSPYERPPLSKQALLEETEPSPVFILDGEKLSQHDITFLSGVPAVRIERNERKVVLEDGREIPYHRLLLATGARPRKFAMEGSDTSNVLYLRTMSDALVLRERMTSGKHIAVIGGGFIGLETAASAIQKGCSVTLIEVAPRILMRGVPKEIADLVEDRHRAAGVDFKIGIGIARIEGDREKHVITLADGTVVTCDALIVGIGAVPETALAGSSGLELDNGIRVDEWLRTSDPNIYAAGDCCSFPHALYEGRRIRLEAWRNAQDQGALAARNMLGAEEPYTTVPWFWSDQYEQTLQVTGLAGNEDTIVHRAIGDSAKMYFHLAADGRLVAASAIGPVSSIAKEIRLAEMLIHKQARPDSSALANPEVKLKTLLQG